MRDILDKLESILLENHLAASHLAPKKMSKVADPKTGKIMSRGELFLHKVVHSSPFTKESDGSEVVINPKEAGKVAQWIRGGMPGTIEMATIDGDMIRNTQLHKTIEFGSTEKETIPLKAVDIYSYLGDKDVSIQDIGNNIENILDAGGFQANDMYDVIVNSPQIHKLGKVGKAIVSMAKQLTEGNVPVFPPGLSDTEIKAIELYASEYLGVLGLVSGVVPFKQGNRGDFDEFVGTDLGSMIIYFPKSVSNPLADSFSVTNDDTGHSIKISSKAAGKGAPPSLNSMKLPDDVRGKYPEAAEFLDTAQNPKVSTYAQPFIMLNAMYDINPDKVPDAYVDLLPFSDSLISQLEESVKSNEHINTKIMNVFFKRLSDKVKNSANTDGGKAWYAVTTDLIKSVNNGAAVPNLREALIESLGYNFIQLYTNVKKGKLVTEAFWPAKLNGNVKLRTKGSADNPKKGKLSVEISPGKDSETIEIGSSTYADEYEPLDNPADSEDNFIAGAEKMAKAGRGTEKPRDPDRKKR